MFFRLRPMLRLSLPAVLLLLISCGPARNQFAPVCPVARLVPALADVTRYTGSGSTHDVTDMIVQARIVSVNGSCQASDDPAVLPAHCADWRVRSNVAPPCMDEKRMFRCSWP